MSVFDPASVKVGGDLHMANFGGWGTPSVNIYKVVRITPGGQIIAKLNNHEIRVNPRGEIAGKRSWSRDRAIHPDRAAEYIAAAEIDRHWAAVRFAGEAIEKAGRGKDPAALAVALAELSAATAKLGDLA